MSAIGDAKRQAEVGPKAQSEHRKLAILAAALAALAAALALLGPTAAA